jgi:putative oxidoreductase
MIGNIFVDNGWEDLRNAEQRSQSIGKSRNFTIFLGTDRNSGRRSRRPRDLTATRGIGTHSRDVGSDNEKVFVWHTGFWGEKRYGWHYDLMLVVMNLVALFTNGGPWVVAK